MMKGDRLPILTHRKKSVTKNNVSKLIQQIEMVVTVAAGIALNSLDSGQKSDGTNTDK